jgi:hypothetical protein
LKVALDLVVNEGLNPLEAAAKVGLHARTMYLALQKPFVLAYLRHARHVLREQARAQNIHHMIEMRSSSPNEMCKLGAMKLIEQDDEPALRSAAHAVAPGLVINVIAPSGPMPRPPTLDLTPVPEPDPPDDAA